MHDPHHHTGLWKLSKQTQALHIQQTWGHYYPFCLSKCKCLLHVLTYAVGAYVDSVGPAKASIFETGHKREKYIRKRSCAFNYHCKMSAVWVGFFFFWGKKRQSAWGLVPELSDREETGPGINGLLIYSSYIIFFPSRAYKSHAPCKNRI